MGSMRQLASMIRHVHETHGLGGAEDSSAEALMVAQGDADFVDLSSQAEPVGDPADPIFQQQ